jgi:hypothetical protein
MRLNDYNLTHNTRAEFDPPVQGFLHTAAQRVDLKGGSSKTGVSPAVKGAVQIHKKQLHRQL